MGELLGSAGVPAALWLLLLSGCAFCYLGIYLMLHSSEQRLMADAPGTRERRKRVTFTWNHVGEEPRKVEATPATPERIAEPPAPCSPGPDTPSSVLDVARIHSRGPAQQLVKVSFKAGMPFLQTEQGELKEEGWVQCGLAGTLHVLLSSESAKLFTDRMRHPASRFDDGQVGFVYVAHLLGKIDVKQAKVDPRPSHRCALQTLRPPRPPSPCHSRPDPATAGCISFHPPKPSPPR